ncbi:hypothetical protein AVEN_232555-2-1, partial [Araneus ventricosus]
SRDHHAIAALADESRTRDKGHVRHFLLLKETFENLSRGLT